MAEPAGFPREDLDTLSRSPSGNDFRRGRGLVPVPTLEESLTPFEAADTWWLAAAIWQATRESPAEPVIPIDSKDSAPEEAHQVKGGEFEPPNERPPDADDAAEANSGDDESRAATPDRSAQVLQLGTMTWSDDIGSGSLLVSSGLAVARSPLSDAVAMARALRPLHRRVLARHGPEGILDEEATAERAVQDQLWLPVIRPVMERWLDLTLVVDANPSTVLWRSTISAFESFLEQLGTFRTIQRRLLDSVALTAGAPEIPMLRGEVADTPPRPPAEVADTTGRRVVLVVTDGVSNRWRDDSFGRVLAHWGRSMPTSVIHLLPQRLWPKGGLRPHRATLTTHGRLKPNARWAVSLPDSWLEPGPEVPEHKVPVPVFELEARWLRRWVQLLLGHNDHPIDTTVWLTDDSRRTEQEIIEKDAENPEKEIPEGVSSLERVNYFRHTASPTAFRLASLLAAVPVTLAVARSVLDELVPEAGVEHLAEVLTSGLFETDPGEGERRRSDNLRYHARQGVREELLSGLRRSDTVRVLCTVSERFGGQFASLRRMYRAISEPNSTPIPDDSVSMSDLANERAVMNALSGPYLERAQRLTVIEDKLSRPSGQEPDTPSVGSRTMSKTAEGTATDPGRPISVASAQTDIPDDEFSTGSQVQSASGYPRSSLSPLLGYERRGDEAPPVWGNVPPRNPNFTGRIEFLENLNRQLAVGPTTAVLPAALHGMGGIGKTQIATEYVYQHLHDYDVVWWIQASSATQIRSGLTELAQALGLPDSNEAITAVPMVLEALRRGHPSRRWLLIFDAAEGPEMVRSFFPTNGPGKVLVTSRNPDWASVASPLEIATFDRDESIELLRRRGPEIDQEDADRLASTLGDLPLAVEQAAAWRAETGMPVSEYLRLFDEKVAEILDVSAPADYEVSVAAAWNVSFDELSTRNPAAHQLLQVCAFFSPEPISRALFSGVRGVNTSPELDEALNDPMRLGRAIRDINRYGLAKIDHRNNTLQLHRLVQLVLRGRMTQEHQVQRRHAAHLLLASLDPNDPQTLQNSQRYRDILPHAYASQLIECSDGWGRQLILNLIKFLYRWGDHDEAIALSESALLSWTDKLGERDSQTLEVASCLGRYYWVVGRYAEAEAIDRKTWEIRKQVDGENNEETLAAQLSLVEDLRPKGDFAGSLEQSGVVYQKAKALFGDEDPLTLNFARRHAINLRLNGKYREAAELDENTYQRAQQVLGPDHPDTLSAFSGLLLDSREAGDYLWARDEQVKLAEQARRVHGENNADTLRRQAYLAVGMRKAGDHEGALGLSKRVLEQFRIRYGLDSFNAMACSLAYSIDLRHAGDLRSSRELGEDVLRRYRDNLGEDHPYTMCATVDLAVTLRQLGDAATAKQLDERALGQLRAMLGPDHPHTIVCAIDYASDLAELGELDQALAVGSETVERSERVLGADHPTTLAASLNLALDQRAQGNAKEAETRYVDVLTLYRKVLGGGHPATISAAKSVRADCDIDPLPL